MGKKYWFLRNRLRQEFVVVGYEKGSSAYQGSSVFSIPAGDKLPTNDWRHTKHIYKHPSTSRSIEFRDLSIGSYFSDSCGVIQQDADGKEIPAGPANSYPNNNCKSTATSYRLQVGDGLQHLGWYMGVLATEYKLLRDHNAPQYQIDETLFELFCAFKAMERLEIKFQNLMTGSSSPTGTGFLPGILLRDDINFYEPPADNASPFSYVLKQDVKKNLNVTDIVHEVVKGQQSATTVIATDYALLSLGIENQLYTGSPPDFGLIDNKFRERIMSPDHVVHILMGLGLVAKFTDYTNYTIRDRKGNNVESFNFKAYIHSYLNRLEKTLVCNHFTLPIIFDSRGVRFAHEFGIGNGGQILAYHILGAIYRIRSENYSNVYPDLSAIGSYTCPAGYPYQANVVNQMLQTSRTSLLTALNTGVWTSLFLAHNSNQFSAAYMASAAAQTSPYITGFQIRSSNIWVGWGPFKIRTKRSCLNFDALFYDAVIGHDPSQLSGVSKFFFDLFTRTFGSSIIGPNNVCINFVDINYDWSYNLTPRLLHGFVKKAFKEPDPGNYSPTMEFYNILSNVMFNGKRDWRDVPDGAQMKNMLEFMSYWGPSYMPEYINLPRSEKELTIPSTLYPYWHASNSFTKPNYSRHGHNPASGDRNDRGKHNGLDYMLAYNLSCLTWPDQFLAGNQNYVPKLLELGSDFSSPSYAGSTVLESVVPAPSELGEAKTLSAFKRVLSGQQIHIGQFNGNTWSNDNSVYLSSTDRNLSNDNQGNLKDYGIHLKSSVPLPGANPLYIDPQFSNLRTSAPDTNAPKKDLTLDSLRASLLTDLKKRISSDRVKKRNFRRYSPISAFAASAPSHFNPSNDKLLVDVFPNPTNEVLFVRPRTLDISSVQVIMHNVLGQVVLDQAATIGDQGFASIDLSGLDASVYSLTLTSGDKKHVVKVVKK